ncbi:hypothetical protein BGZ76_001203 [Entomortierella beljakovae]|nr:hypothetical protein BGZ76_001203 [Entomortierella beljakovae]
MNPSTWRQIHGNAFRNENLIMTSIRSASKPNYSIRQVNTIRNYIQYTPSKPISPPSTSSLLSISSSKKIAYPSLKSAAYLPNSTFTPHSRFTLVVRRAFASSSNPATTTTSTNVVAPKKSSGMMDKIKDMIKKYGYTGVVVYLGISMIDLAATFVLVKALGMEKIELAQDWVIDHAGRYFGYKKDPHHHHSHDGQDDLDKLDDEQVGAIYNKASGLWSVFVIAYGIHKLLVPFRVVATSMITPPLVKWLIKRGWMKPVIKSSAAATTTAAVASESIKP